MRDKKASLYVDRVQYIYSIRVSAYVIKIMVYRSSEKTPLFTAYVDYIEAWGFDIYRPKMIEILIRYYLENNSTLTDREIVLCEHPVLFQELLDFFFQGATEQVRMDFVEKCRKIREISR